MIETPLRQRFGYLTTITATVPIFVVKGIEAEAERRKAAGIPSARGPSHDPNRAEVTRDVLVAWALSEGRRCGAYHEKHGVCALESGHDGDHNSNPASVYPHRWSDGGAPLVGGLGSDE